ncbi:hypothetical protein K0M31_020244 [Melipona bicolor]|uniref:Uncharacterized protein n=1 Tax=Melipona bicolor TaxID=60889 RepID=A0AA40G138_9HYME|nr:hypothetical protein K0M31_020244 [Melipona bicolor]
MRALFEKGKEHGQTLKNKKKSPHSSPVEAYDVNLGRVGGGGDPLNSLIFGLKTLARLILIHVRIIAGDLPNADLSYPAWRPSSSNKLERDLNPYFTYRAVARLQRNSEGRGEAEEARRVLNLKVKPPPLLPNPRAEREGCSALLRAIQQI